MSSKGLFIVFRSKATNLVPGFTDNNGSDDDLFVINRKTGSITLVSHAAGSTTSGGNDGSFSGSMSADGRFIAFVSLASDLVSGFTDANGLTNEDVFVFDMNTGAITLASHAVGSTTTGGNGFSTDGIISEDGRRVAFDGKATDLIAGFVDNNTATGQDVFFFDTQTGAVTLASRATSGPTASGNDGSTLTSSGGPGDVVEFSSFATDLVAGFTNNNATDRDAFAFDTTTGLVSLVSHAPGSSTSGGNGSTSARWSSSDGRFVLIRSHATNLVSGFTDNNATDDDLFLLDRKTDTMTLVSHAAGSTTSGGNGDIFDSVMTSSGAYVAFSTSSTNLVAGFTNNNAGNRDVFLSGKGGKITLVSHAVGSTTSGGNGDTSQCEISGNGRAVAFTSQSTNLVTGFTDNNGIGNDDAFLFSKKSIVLVSHSTTSVTTGALGTVGGVGAPGKSGSFVPFSSTANDHIAGFTDNNGGSRDMFVFAA